MGRWRGREQKAAQHLLQHDTVRQVYNIIYFLAVYVCILCGCTFTLILTYLMQLR
jgi:hypothetical protein